MRVFMPVDFDDNTSLKTMEEVCEELDFKLCGIVIHRKACMRVI